MAENSHIEWTDHTFNPWIGCTKVSPACDHCYAEAWDARGLQGQPTRWGPHADRTRTSAGNWRKPLAWSRKAAAEGRRYKVFCASLADVFDNHRSILPDWRTDLWRLIQATPNLDWLLLTKRPQNIARYLPAFMRPFPNLWLGTTAENQEEADRRVPVLLSIPATVRFLSCEPMLGRIRLSGVSADGQHKWNWLTGETGTMYPDGPDFDHGPKIHWVICGGESGPGARPMHPDWARSLRDQCIAAGVPFLFKQWGEWGPGAARERRPDWKPGDLYQTKTVFGSDGWIAAQDHPWSYLMERFGKKAAGRMLDGRTWDEVPV